FVPWVFGIQNPALPFPLAENRVLNSNSRLTRAGRTAVQLTQLPVRRLGDFRTARGRTAVHLTLHGRAAHLARPCGFSALPVWLAQPLFNASFLPRPDSESVAV
ncbi:unnamed protein product, partial [Linum tenue]